MTPPAARQPGEGAGVDVEAIRSRYDEWCASAPGEIRNQVAAYLISVDIPQLLTFFATPALLAAEYQRGVEEVLALLNPRQHAIMTFDELRQQARALIPGEGVQR